MCPHLELLWPLSSAPLLLIPNSFWEEMDKQAIVIKSHEECLRRQNRNHSTFESMDYVSYHKDPVKFIYCVTFSLQINKLSLCVWGGTTCAIK